MRRLTGIIGLFIGAATVLSCVTSARAAEAPVLRFDLGTEDSPLFEGYLRVTKDTLYTPEQGYGWAAVAPEHHTVAGKPAAKPGQLPGLFDRDRKGAHPLHRDLVMAVAEYHPLVRHEFLVDVPNDTYEVSVLSGDEGYPSGAFSVSVQGHEPLTVAERPAGEFTEFITSARVTDGKLSIVLDAEEYWTANAVLVYPLAQAETVRKQEKEFFSFRARRQQAAKLRAEMDALSLEQLRQRCIPYLLEVCDWILDHDVGSNELKDVQDTRHSIFINGNLARVLMSAYHLTGQRQYLDEALRWCDSFISEQNPVETSKGNPGGWWSDVGPNNNIYLADTGTATSALVFGLKYMEQAQRERSLEALTRYASFVREGTKQDPQGKGRDVCSGWVIPEGDAAGALGCGYYRGHLSTGPYTIATATTGCLMFSQLFSVTGNQEYRQIAVDGARWLLSLIGEDGTIPYIIDGETGTRTWWLVVTYCGEALIAVHELIADEALRADIRKGLARVVERALAEQSPEGIWGKPRDFDGQRSGLVLQVLWWYYTGVDERADIAEALRKAYAYLLVPELAQRYGMNELVRPTGFIGLAAADFIRPGVTLECGYLGP